MKCRIVKYTRKNHPHFFAQGDKKQYFAIQESSGEYKGRLMAFKNTKKSAQKWVKENC
jgi:hypothetical protein